MAVGPTISFVIRSLKLCVFPLASTGVGVVTLAALPQGTEVLRTINDNGFWHPHTQSDDFTLVIAFLAALSLWSLGNWYAARLLVQRDFGVPGAAPGVPPAAAAARFENHWREWFPRALVPLSIVPIAAALAGRGQFSVAWLCAGLALGLFSFVVWRRRLFSWVATLSHHPPGPRSVLPSAKPLRGNLPEGEVLMLWLVGSLAIVIFTALGHVNYSFARWLGGASILLLALATIGVFASLVLVYWPKIHRWPAMTGIAIVAALSFGAVGVTANHGIASRRVDAEKQTRVDRPLASVQLRQWLEHASNPARCPPPGCSANDPIVLVAAEGGASRSAWWTAHVLGVLDEMTSGRFGHRVHAASGISGGSLGVATWVALRRDLHDAATPRPAAASGPVAQTTPHPKQSDCDPGNVASAALTVKSACFLGRDFVSPILGYMLGVDLAQRIIPVPVDQWDRSRGLENTWAQDWHALFKSRAFDRPLMDLYRPFQHVTDPHTGATTSTLRADIPILLLNTATVDRGRPAVQAPVRMSDAEIDDLLDPSLRTAGLTLSGAVHNSARFPYVSPGGDVLSTVGEHFDSVVDGGYIENSGALALAALMRSIEADTLLAHPDCKDTPASCKRWTDLRERLVVLFIANDPNEPLPSGDHLCDSQARPLDLHARNPWGEAATPPIGLFKARSSRADSSRRALVRELRLCDGSPQDPRVYFVSMASATVQETNPVMSWYMTPHSREVMWRAAATAPARGELLRLARRLGVEPAQAQQRLDAFGVIE